MSTNPFLSPDEHGGLPSGGDPPVAIAKSKVSGPAISLMIVSAICVVCVGIAIPLDPYLLGSGEVEEMRQPEFGITIQTQMTIRLSWAIVLFGVNVYIFIAALRMKRLQNYSMAKTAAILSVIPCLGPCYLLGIPFGIWALVVLADPNVKAAFSHLTLRQDVI